HACRGLEREFVRAGKILSTDFDRVEPQLLRDEVDGALDDVRSLWTAGAAVSICRHLVREDAGNVDLNRADLVAAGQHQPAERRHGGCEELEVRSEVTIYVVAQPRNRPVVLEAYLDRTDLTATMYRRLDILAPVFDPLHRAREPHRDPPEERLLA